MASDSSPVELTGPNTTNRARRPFLKLAPLLVPRELPADIGPSLLELEERVGDDVQIAVRALVNFTVARQIAAQRAAGRTGKAVGVPYAVLNRRRRAAREWVVALLGGKVDQPTLHNLAHLWIPQLAGTGPDRQAAIRPGRDMVEFLRGSLTALVMTGFAANLIPHARALYALETVLSIHLHALENLEDPGV